jgi:hypothetical protein
MYLDHFKVSESQTDVRGHGLFQAGYETSAAASRLNYIPPLPAPRTGPCASSVDKGSQFRKLSTYYI